MDKFTLKKDKIEKMSEVDKFTNFFLVFRKEEEEEMATFKTLECS